MMSVSWSLNTSFVDNVSVTFNNVTIDGGAGQDIFDISGHAMNGFSNGAFDAIIDLDSINGSFILQQCTGQCVRCS